MMNPLQQLQSELHQLRTMISVAETKANSIANKLDDMCGSMASSPKRVDQKAVAEVIAARHLKNKLRTHE